MSRLSLVDVFWYSWLCLFWLVLCVAFPPAALGYLALPAIHRRRAAGRVQRAKDRQLARKVAWIESL